MASLTSQLEELEIMLLRRGVWAREADRVSVLAVADELGGERDLSAPGAAQRADDALAGSPVDVHVLAGQRRASAVRAAVAVGLEGSDAPAQKHPFQLLDMGRGGGHRSGVRRPRAGSS